MRGRSPAVSLARDGGVPEVGACPRCLARDQRKTALPSASAYQVTPKRVLHANAALACANLLKAKTRASHDTVIADSQPSQVID
jgi:hypothetical protein